MSDTPVWKRLRVGACILRSFVRTTYASDAAHTLAAHVSHPTLHGSAPSASSWLVGEPADWLPSIGGRMAGALCYGCSDVGLLAACMLRRLGRSQRTLLVGGTHFATCACASGQVRGAGSCPRSGACRASGRDGRAFPPRHQPSAAPYLGIGLPCGAARIALRRAWITPPLWSRSALLRSCARFPPRVGNILGCPRA